MKKMQPGVEYEGFPFDVQEMVNEVLKEALR